ncbi:hypothetical protein AB205_0201330 [Aquarana catesbeiana]|uniref:Chromodomain helicase DNA binding protein 9 n=1 Tax=Aquarana catesbeiana TaxID=8400 RepID=A0A2G9P2W8_AQUCT|nr:hypothetical protein AB205_0201330 [Aquarana catesbeiana]
MTDPMMDFFDDTHLFDETLGLSDDAFAQHDAVSLVDELNLGAEFEPLHVDSLNHVQDSQTHQKISEFDPLSQFDSIKLHPVNQSYSSPVESVLSPRSQFSCSPIHPPSQGNGIFSDDGSPMWGHQTATSIPSQNGSPFHQHGHTQTMHQNKGFVTHHDFALFQASEQQRVSAPQPQHNRHSISACQETLTQQKNFIDINVSLPHRTSNVQQTPMVNHTNLQDSLPLEQFSQSAASLHFCSNPIGTQHESTFDSHSPAPCSVNATPPFSAHYPFSNNHLNHGTHSLSDFTESPGFPELGTKQEPCQHVLNPSEQLHSNDFHMVHSSHPQGNYNGTKMSPMTISFPSQDGSSVRLSHFNDHMESNGFSPLEDNLLQQVNAQTEPFTGLDPEDLLQEDLLPHFDDAAYVQESSNSHQAVLEHPDNMAHSEQHSMSVPNDLLNSQRLSQHNPWSSTACNHLSLIDRQHVTSQGKMYNQLC